MGVERCSSYGQSDICVQGHSKFPFGQAGEPLSVQLDAPAWKVLFEEQCWLLLRPPVSPSHQVSVADGPFGCARVSIPNIPLAQQQPGPWKSFHLLQELWIRFTPGNHTAEDQWLMNIHGKSSFWLRLPRGMNSRLLLQRGSMDPRI